MLQKQVIFQGMYLGNLRRAFQVAYIAFHHHLLLAISGSQPTPAEAEIRSVSSKTNYDFVH